jgi:hypothetical protein
MKKFLLVVLATLAIVGVSVKTASAATEVTPTVNVDPGTKPGG